MTSRNFIKFWQDTATDDFKTAEELFSLKRYHHALFFCHLSIEKYLKGLIYSKTGHHALPIHDLKKLAKQAGIDVSEDKEKQLEEITTWNIRARYDDYKRKFYKKATPDFTLKWLKRVKVIILWLKNQY